MLRVSTCSDIFRVPWKYSFSSPFSPSKAKHEYAHKGPQFRTWKGNAAICVCSSWLLQSLSIYKVHVHVHVACKSMDGIVCVGCGRVWRESITKSYLQHLNLNCNCTIAIDDSFVQVVQQVLSNMYVFNAKPVAQENRNSCNQPECDPLLISAQSFHKKN